MERCVVDQINRCPVDWGRRMNRLLLCSEVRHPPTKHSDGEVPVMLELWGMRIMPSVPLLPGPLWPKVV